MAGKWLRMVGYTAPVTADTFDRKSTQKVRFPIFEVETVLSPEKAEELAKLQTELTTATSAAKKKNIQEKIDALMK